MRPISIDASHDAFIERFFLSGRNHNVRPGYPRTRVRRSTESSAS